MLLTKILTAGPAVGLIGLALYQAINQHDVQSAFQSVMQAALALGFGGVVHTVAAAVTPSPQTQAQPPTVSK